MSLQVSTTEIAPQHLRSGAAPLGNAATAPYNFVPLPEAVITVIRETELAGAESDAARDALLGAALPPHDRYVEKHYSGHIDVILVTRSPIFVRAPLSMAEFAANDKGDYADGSSPEKDKPPEFARLAKNKAEFFNTQGANMPSIPGSSLRGMLRAIVEIAAHGKIQPVGDQNLFFRTVQPSAIGDAYRGRLNSDTVGAGFLVRNGEGYAIAPCLMARVPRTLLANDFADLYDHSPPNRTPKWDGTLWKQHQRVWVILSANGRFVDRIFSEPMPHAREGVVVFTGDVPGKLKEFVFLIPADDADTWIRIPDAQLSRFHDEDQMTRWQRSAFPMDEPKKKARKQNGWLIDEPELGDEPLFFLREGNALTFFGRAGMFRLPYVNRPVDLVTSPRASDGIDLAEAIFGFIGSDNAGDAPAAGRAQKRAIGAYASRVSVTEAVLLPDQENIWWTATAITPRILATPKPTSFQHYLTQSQTGIRRLNHYDTDGGVGIRGHKIYWHRGIPSRGDVTEPEPIEATDSQHTQIRPVRPGLRFRFRVYFDNLKSYELGALAWAIILPGPEGNDYCHSIGMGKSLGLGAVKLTPEIALVDRRSRYQKLFESPTNTIWRTGEELTTRDFVAGFERMVLRALESVSNQPSPARLRDVPRMQRLFALLEWRNPDTKIRRKLTMGLADFRQRLVLPDALDALM